MAQRSEYIAGKVSWVKAIAPNQWGKWTVTVHPTPESLELIRNMQAEGLKNVIKKDDDGYFTTFSRATSSLIRGKVVGRAPPKVFDKDMQPIDGTNIGNGSDGVVKLEVYSHGTPGGGKAIAARWDSLRVDNLIPFEKERDFTEEDVKQTGALESAKSPLF